MDKVKIFKIYDDKQKLLRTTLDEVTLPLDAKTRQTIIEMVDYLKASQEEDFQKAHPNIRAGIGLSANQIGINKRFFAIYMLDEDGNEIKYGLVNPKIIKNSLRKCALRSGEGCLSVKNDRHGYVYRYAKITLRAFDVFENKVIDIKAEGYLAIALQHELDHLNGVLYYDHINKYNPEEIIDNSYLIG